MTATTAPDRIQEIRARVDLLTLVSEVAGHPVRITGGTAYFHCPAPGHDDHDPSFTVGIEGQYAGTWKCWSSCSTKRGDAIDFVSWFYGEPIGAAIRRLSDRLGIEGSIGTPVPKKKTVPRPIVEARELPPETAEPVLTRFLEKRGWSKETADMVGLTVVTRRGEAWVRFPFPQSADGERGWYQDRRVGPGSPRWMSPPGKTPWPFEGHRLGRAREVGCAIVLEGVSDVVALLDWYPDAAVIGVPGSKSFKVEWKRVFTGLEVVVIADNDAGGQQFREEVEAVLNGVARCVVQAYVPTEFNDLDQWRQATGIDFPEHLIASIEEAERAASLEVS